MPNNSLVDLNGDDLGGAGEDIGDDLASAPASTFDSIAAGDCGVVVVADSGAVAKGAVASEFESDLWNQPPNMFFVLLRGL
jgi:hypothetical protein